MSEMSTHWDGCEAVHPECRAAKLEAENKRLRQALEHVIEAAGAMGSSPDYKSALGTIDSMFDVAQAALLRGEP
jgi:hypothetical protein